LIALAELDRNGGNIFQTAKETGISTRTLGRWWQQRGESQQPVIEAPGDDATLDERLEHLAYQLVEAMPQALDEANLHQIIEALKFVLDKIGQTGDDKGADVYEKLAHLINRYAADGPADGDPEPIDGGAG
jgi:hypothetical protein